MGGILVADTIHNSIVMSKLEKEIISLRIFNRLHNISQTSTTYLTFPSNKTRRFEHSLGTMFLSGEMFFYSIANADTKVTETFFEEFKEILDTEIHNTITSETDTIFTSDFFKAKMGDKNHKESKLQNYDKIELCDKIFNYRLPGNISSSDKVLYSVLYQSVRIAGLLHDIGHPPFSHITENALTYIYGHVSAKGENGGKLTKREIFFKEIIDNHSDKEKPLHESIGDKITNNIFKDIIMTYTENDFDNNILYDQLFKSLVAITTISILSERNQFYKQIHRLIDGALDGDRLDYVTRDVINSGFDSGKIEYDRLIVNMALKKTDKDEYTFAVNTKTLETVEDFFRRRWKLYKDIIHHHRVIKTDYLLEDCIIKISISYLESQDDEVFTENDKILPYNISGLWKSIIADPSIYSSFNLLMQWDDYWLWTILKKHYFEEYFDTEKNTVLEKQLEELLANKKYYYSVIKKQDDFDTIDSYTNNQFIKRIDEFEKLTKADSEIFLKKDMIELLNCINAKNTSKGSLSNYGFTISMIKLGVFASSEAMFKKMIQDALNKVESNYPDIKNVLLVFKKRKTGINESLFMYNSNTPDEVKIFSKLSKENNNLNHEMKCLPPFFIYILSGEDKKFNFQSFKQDLGVEIANQCIINFNKFKVT